MKKILVPTDGSSNATHAINYALNLFKGEQMEFFLFRSYDIPAYAADIPVLTDNVGADELKRLIDSDAENFRKTHAHQQYTFNTHVAAGSLAFNIESVVEEMKIDLVIMGTKGASGIAAAIIGSNTSDVIQAATCPVLAVPENAVIAQPTQILFATDNKGLSDPGIVTPMMDIAKLSGAHIHLMNVLDEGEVTTVDEAVEGLKMDHLLEDIEHTFHFESGWDKAQVIENHLNTHNIDLLAVIPRKNNFFDAIFHRSVTRKLALHTKTPLLAMHDLG